MKYTNYTNNTSVTNNTSYILQNVANTKKVLHSKLIQLVKNKYLTTHQEINNELTSHLPIVKCFTNTPIMFSGTLFNDLLYLTDSGEISFNHLSSLAIYKTHVYDITIISNFTNGYAVYKFSITFDNYGKILYYENYSATQITVGFEHKLHIIPWSPGTITTEIILTGIKLPTSTTPDNDFTIKLIKTVDTLTRWKLKFIPGGTLANGSYNFYTRVVKSIY